MHRLFVVVSSGLPGLIPDEIIGEPDVPGDTEQLLSLGALREILNEDPVTPTAILCDTLILPTTVEKFCLFLHTKTSEQSIPHGSGTLHLDRGVGGPIPVGEEYELLYIHGSYFGLRDEETAALPRVEHPLTWRILVLAPSRLKVQARCVAPVAFPYYEQLLHAVRQRWPLPVIPAAPGMLEADRDRSIHINEARDVYISSGQVGSQGAGAQANGALLHQEVSPPDRQS